MFHRLRGAARSTDSYWELRYLLPEVLLKFLINRDCGIKAEGQDC